MAKNKKRIGNIMFILMTTIAVVFEIIEVVLVFFFGAGLFLNRIITILEYGIFIPWFWILGVNFTKLTSKNADKRLITVIVTAIIEMIPGLGLLPSFTFMTVRTIIITRFEDRGLSNERLEALAKGRVLSRNKTFQKTVGEEVEQLKEFSKRRQRVLNRQKLRGLEQQTIRFGKNNPELAQAT